MSKGSKASKASKSQQTPAPDFSKSKPLTQENFEKELKDLAAAAKSQTTAKFVSQQLRIVLKAASLLALAAVSSNVSQLNLSPVYGSIPSSIHHAKVVTTACFLGWSGNLFLRRWLPTNPLLYLPVLAACIAPLQYFLFSQSSLLGVTYGPLVIEIMTYLPLLVLTVASTASILEELDISFLGGQAVRRHVGDSLPGILSYVFFKTTESVSASHLSNIIGQTVVQTRIGLQLVLTALYSISAPSKLILWALPAVFHTVLLNPHFQGSWTTHNLNATLHAEGWSLLARQESLTGYVSVLESHTAGYRLLRCDHSLLGGEWVRLPQGVNSKHALVKEPIYAIFAMLEAVRLVEVPHPVPDSSANALVIGVGIGTTPSALIKHNISTTIVEIDPVVYDYAVNYFHLPDPHTAIIEDAITYTSTLASSINEANVSETNNDVAKENQFTYIIHDVFTGGAEPAELFTHEFLSTLSALLAPNGVIAINYAGDLLLPSTQLVMRTILSVFPTCRIFRELTAPTEDDLLALEAKGQARRDFTNIVIFCTKFSAEETEGKKGIAFREPTEEDFLGSGARRRYLMPEHEIFAEAFLGEESDPSDVLRANETERLSEWQKKSAVGHWEVMRTVLPAWIWEKW